ncbi:MAG: 1-acyl-sn-glycerol-3-phosphate acyltransferase [Bacteroidaceae bacterium]|nr:1-acyl-sn-glycerol-3-phosphate acyltransferase [Bacteroidaceae bacterium]
MIDPKEFDAIRPYNNDEIPGVVNELLHDRLMNAQLKTLLPWLPQWIRNGVLRLAFIGIHSTLDFQLRFMKPIVGYILRKCSNGATFEHSKITAGQERYTFMSNHRDIVLDSAILDYLLHKYKFPTTCEIAIGDNLLIYPWIEKVVKLNKAFTVRRGLGSKDLLKSSMLMSQYIHYAVNQKHENIWIAQREGRAKDSSDTTQESVLKMLAMGSEEENPVEQLRDLNIVPLTISYEYDPCDYLKATEFQLKRDNPAYKKSKADDENNMREGIWGFKGSIHYEAAPCINTWLDELKDLPKNEFFTEVAHRIDQQIHAGYKLFPGNYVAADLLNNSSKFASFYTEAQKQQFLNYLQQRLGKIEIENKDEAFLRERMLTMYANPVFNKQKALKA